MQRKAAIVEGFCRQGSQRLQSYGKINVLLCPMIYHKRVQTHPMIERVRLIELIERSIARQCSVYNRC